MHACGAETLGVRHRVTPEKGVPVEADHPGRAWKEVLAATGAERRAAGLSGPRMFGLDNPAIARMIQALPHAGRCASFDAWLGERPPCEPLVRLTIFYRLKLLRQRLDLLAPQ